MNKSLDSFVNLKVNRKRFESIIFTYSSVFHKFNEILLKKWLKIYMKNTYTEDLVRGMKENRKWCSFHITRTRLL